MKTKQNNMTTTAVLVLVCLMIFPSVSAATDYINTLDGANQSIGDVPLFVDNTNGNVGIGTTSPSQELEITGDILLTNLNDGIMFSDQGENISSEGTGTLDLNSRGYIEFQGDTNNNDPDTDDTFNFKIAGSSVMVIENNGEVGIGTASPGYLLHVSKDGGGGDNAQLARFTDTSTANSVGPLNLTIGADNHFTVNPGIVLAGINSISLAVGDGSDLSNQRDLTIISTGEVGIGDTTPTNDLDVTGTIGISDTTIIDASRNLVNILTLDTGQGAYELYAMNQDVETTDEVIFLTTNYADSSEYWLATATNWGLYWNTTTNTLEFHGGGTDVANIDLDNGNLQIDGDLTVSGNDLTFGSGPSISSQDVNRLVLTATEYTYIPSGVLYVQGNTVIRGDISDDTNGAVSVDDDLYVTGDLSVGDTTADIIVSYGGFTGNASANIGGTGDAAYFPEGIYSAKQNWLYGGIAMNGGALSSVGTIDTGFGAKEIGDSVGNCATTDVHKGDGGCEAESSLSVSSATTATTATNANACSADGTCEMSAATLSGILSDGSESMRFNTGYGDFRFGTGNSGNYGLLVYGNGVTTTYANLQARDGNVYLADTGTYASYFLRGNGADATIRGDLTVSGGDLTLSGTSQITAGGAESTYGALTVDGTKNSYSGINFRSGATNYGTLMVTASIQGFYDDADTGWDWYWTNGQLTSGDVPSTRLSDGGTIVFDWVDAEVADTLTIGASSVVAGDAITDGTIDATELAADSVTTSELKTATTSYSGTASTGLRMNDYMFFPNFEMDDCNAGSGMGVNGRNANVANDYVGTVDIVTGACTASTSYDVWWRYVSASDHPTIWVLVNEDESYNGIWQGEDPIHPDKYPENPSPFEGSVQKGQRDVTVPPFNIEQLEKLYAALPEQDRTEIFQNLKEYVVDKRGWLENLTQISDLAKIRERYNPSGRFWAMRFVAKHYEITASELIMVITTLNNGELALKPDVGQILQNHLVQRKINLAENERERAELEALPENQKNADIAEWYEANQELEPGDILVMGESGFVEKSKNVYDADVISVVSTAPEQILGRKNSDGDVKLAIVGRVPVKVSLENGPINPGDRLTTSSTPGVAMKQTKPGPSIGVAIEGTDNDGKVLTFLNVGLWIPQGYDIAELFERVEKLEALLQN